MTHRGVVVLAAGLVAFAACEPARVPREERIPDRIENRVRQARGESVKRLYEHRHFEPVWTDPRARQSLLAAIEATREHGLDPRAYDVDRLRTFAAAEPAALEPDAAAERDVASTSALLACASDLANGREEPRAEARSALVGSVEEMLGSGRIEEGLRALAPQHDRYQHLREALGRYRGLADSGGWPAIPGADAPPELIQQRLAAEGDHDLRAFQERHGLDGTGTLDPPTVQAMNVSPADRAKQIAVNLERWRRLPRDFSKRYVWVNTAAFWLEAVDGGSRVLQMKIIVGNQYNPTPIFWDRMAYIIFNPYWNIPDSIAHDEILPKGPAYMKREGIEVEAGGKLRQKPGAKNPLGRLKFMFPNQFNVYLHDTPTDRLFKRRSRELSHGCIRLEKPIDLAEFVLAPSGQWDRRRISAAIESGETKKVDLPDPVPVYILYWTAWVDDSSGVEFRDDVYGYDAAFAQQAATADAAGVSPP